MRRLCVARVQDGIRALGGSAEVAQDTKLSKNGGIPVPKWPTLYAAAMLESDSARLHNEFETPAGAIRERLPELPETSCISSERVELHTPLSYLQPTQASPPSAC